MLATKNSTRRCESFDVPATTADDSRWWTVHVRLFLAGREILWLEKDMAGEVEGNEVGVS